MSKNLIVSAIDRQNILNNSYALQEIRKNIGITGIEFHGKIVLLKEQLASFFEVTPRTIELYASKYEAELRNNGYEIVKGLALKELKQVLLSSDVPEIDFGSINKISQLAVFDFRAFLNLSMLITDSEKAKVTRQVILDIVIDTINKRTGGGTKYINQRDEDFLISYFEEENYRSQFTEALKNCVVTGKFKYALYTNKIYVSIFKEKSGEYRKVLNLDSKARVRSTFYSEVLDLVSSYECGLADAIGRKYLESGKLLEYAELDRIFSEFENQAHWKPLIDKARSKMASRDLAFRDALHMQLKEYIRPLNEDEFERFLGEKSKEFSERLDEAKDVMKRLKERE